MNKTMNKAVTTTLSVVNKLSPVKLNKNNLLIIILAIVVIIVLIPKLYKSKFTTKPVIKISPVESVTTTGAPVESVTTTGAPVESVTTTGAPIKKPEGLLDILKKFISDFSDLFSKLKLN